MSEAMVPVPKDLFARLYEEARRRSMVAAAIARSEERFQRAGSFESADLVRAERDSRR